MKDLLAWFGLKHFPFDKNIKTQDVFPTDALKECSARLEYIKRKGGILLLTGDPGVGKTLALRRYVDSLNGNLFKPFYTPLSTLSRSDLLYHINRLLGLTPRLSKSAIYSQIQRAFLESKETAGKTILLIIDEAHLLQTGPLEELRLLTNFKMDSYDPFILILSGQSDLRRTMEFAVMEPFNQRIAIRYHMPPLSPEETRHCYLLRFSCDFRGSFSRDNVTDTWTLISTHVHMKSLSTSRLTTFLEDFSYEHEYLLLVRIRKRIFVKIS